MSKVKELEQKLYASTEKEDKSKLMEELQRTRKAVFVDEGKMQDRLDGFKRAASKANIKEKTLSEFM
jgi:hypothetical protein